MSLAPISSPTRPIPASTGATRGDVSLRGLRLRLLQVLWLVLVIIDVGTLITNLPIYYHALFTICTGPLASCQITDQLTAQTLVTLQRAGFSLHTYAFYVIFWDSLTTLSFLLIGAIIIWRRANTWMGLFVSFLLLNLGLLGVSFAHVQGISPNSSSNPVLNFLIIASTFTTILTYPCLAFFFFTFPDGRLVPRWSWALVSLWAVNAFFWIAPSNTPFNLVNWSPLLEAGWLSVVFGGSACTQLYRFLRVASPLQRQQIKWLLYGFMPVIVLPICLTLYMTFVPPLNKPGAFLVNTPDSFLLIVTLPLYRFYYLPVPFCVGIALLRYRLWDIDRIINRTLVYGLLTGILALLYLGLVLGLQFLFDRVAGPITANSPLILVGSTLVIAALFQPLRHRIQSTIDRRFYRRKYDARHTIANFNATLRGEVELAQLSEQLILVIEETMQPTHVSLWINKPQQSRYVYNKQEDSPVSAVP